jgi:prepilin-type N-terminal cleavage/methylation domain-containing protein
MKMNNKAKKAFSLVELLVAMAIIAVLIAIAAYGIQIVQRNARNTKRRKIVQDLQLLIADIQTNTFSYPGELDCDGVTTCRFITGSDEDGIYEVKGFNSASDVSGGCPEDSSDGMSLEEETPNNIQLCYSQDFLTIGVALEGNEEGFVTDI